MNIANLITLALVIMLMLSSCIQVTGETNLDKNQETLQTTEDKEVSQRYAVIFVGQYFGMWFNFQPIKNYKRIQQYYTWYLNDAGQTYKMLRDTYGYSEENIFLLVKLLPECLFDIPTEQFNKSWVDGTCDEEILEDVLTSFKIGGSNELSENDSLLFLMIDHGGIYDDGGINWVKPDKVNYNDWRCEFLAIDNLENTFASYHKTFDNNWTDQPLIIKMDELLKIKGFRIKSGKDSSQDKIRIRFYNDSEIIKQTILNSWVKKDWEYLVFRNITTQEIQEYEIDRIEISFHENNANVGFKVHPAKVYDFELWPADSLNDIQKAFFALTFNTLFKFLNWKFNVFNGELNLLYDWELANYIDNISAKMIFLFQPCFGGAFIDKISGENRIICTASRGFEPADSWIGPFRRALNKEVDADYNFDGNISIAEAYEYTAKWVIDRYGNLFHPIIDDNADRIGTHYNETSYNSSMFGMDGYLAANTFLNLKISV